MKGSVRPLDTGATSIFLLLSAKINKTASHTMKMTLI